MKNSQTEKAKTIKTVRTAAEKIHSAYTARGFVLDPREQDIIIRYYGFDGQMRHTLEEIAKHYGVSRERIRQIKHYSIKKLENENKKGPTGDSGTE